MKKLGHFFYFFGHRFQVTILYQLQFWTPVLFYNIFKNLNHENINACTKTQLDVKLFRGKLKLWALCGIK